MSFGGGNSSSFLQQQLSTFQIPKGYEDFVSSSQDLLSQFEDTGEVDNDQVCYHIYLDDLITNPCDIYQQYHSLHKLKQTIEELVRQEVSGHIWHRGESFHVEIVCPIQLPQEEQKQKKKEKKKTAKKSVKFSGTDADANDCDNSVYSMMYLKGVTNFGENIEDEWFIVYLFMKLTRILSNISVRIFDNDGDFLMIETAEHIPDWLGPENVLNRVWIKQGLIHIIPLEATGAIKKGGAMKLLPALKYLCDDPMSCRVHGNVQRIVASRTTKVFPAKVKALEHNVVCIVPEWVANAFQQNVSLVAQAIRAFSGADSKDLSSMLSNVTIPLSSGDDQQDGGRQCIGINMEKLVTTKIRMTRTLYAQLTFKQFKIPRKYHGMMRRMATFNSAKVSNAFNIGCRLACGLELAYAESCQEELDQLQWKRRNTRLLREALRVNHFLDEQAMEELVGNVFADPVKSRQAIHVEEGDEDGGYVVDDDDNDRDKATREEFLSLLGIRSKSSVSHIVHTLSLSSSDHSLDDADASAAHMIMNDTIVSDSDSWMYMSPEQLDAEMQSRITQFSDLLNASDDDQTTQEPSENQGDTNDIASNKLRKEDQPSTMETLDQDDNDENEIKRLQKIVDDFKSFLDEQSDFDGITGSNSVNSNSNGKNHKMKLSGAIDSSSASKPLSATIAPDITPFDETLFDMNYLVNTLKSVNLHLDGSVINEEISNNASAVMGPCREVPTEPVIVGVAEKVISIVNSDNQTNNEVESIDSDDEIENTEEHNSDGSDDVSEDNEDGAEDSDDEDTEDEDDHTPWNLDDLKNQLDQLGMKFRDASGDENGHIYEEGEEDYVGEEFSMEDLQRVMDGQLFDEKALANTFSHLFKERSDGERSSADFDDMDLDANFLMSMMEAHAEGLGAPSGAINQILGQLGLSLPRPPPVQATRIGKSTGKK